MLKKIIIPIILLFSSLIFNLSCHPQEKHDYDVVFVNGLIIDGTGSSAYRADIGIADGIIKKIGKITKQGKFVVDIEGKIISPGFIDTHSHHDEGMFKMSHMLAAVSQGITTIFIGQDGFSDYPLSELVDKMHNHPIAVNIASFFVNSLYLFLEAFCILIMVSGSSSFSTLSLISPEFSTPKALATLYQM